jgi:hypothetical protein
MKYFILGFFLTISVAYSQDSYELPPEELAPTELSPESLAPIVDAPPLTEENKATDQLEPEMTLSKEVTQKPEEPQAPTETVLNEDLKLKAPMATFGVRGIAPEAVSKANVDEDDDSFNHRKANWVGTFGFESTKYTLPFAFQGDKANFKEEERELWGGRLGFGGEFYLGWGFLFGARLDGYYLGTLFEDAKTANPEYDVDVASEKNNGHMYGGDAIAHFGWMFDFKTKNPFLAEMTYLAIELFAEAGVGRGRAYNRKNYFFNASPATDELYDIIIEDDYTSQIVSGGINILSTSTGAFLNLKVSTVALDITERKIRGTSKPNGQAATNLKDTIKNPDTDPITIFTLGGGIKF